MYLEKYLVVGARGSVRVTKKRPALASDEIMVRLELILLDSLWKKPVVIAKVKIAEDAVTPAELSMEVISHLQEVIERGTDLRIELVPMKEKEEELSAGPD